MMDNKLENPEVLGEQVNLFVMCSLLANNVIYKWAGTGYRHRSERASRLQKYVKEGISLYFSC